MKKLKKLRTVFSAILALLMTVLFLDVSGNLPHGLSAVGKLQFLPAVLSFCIGMVAFWLVVSLLFGRAYCSSVCPMGTFQDLFARIGKTVRGKRKSRYRYSKPKNRLRYSVLGLCALSLLFGLPALPALLDPYSAYGRMVAGLLQPVWASAHNLAASGGLRLAAVDVMLPGAVGMAVSAITFLAVGFLAFRNGRTFCNTVCPVGAAFSLFSRKSVWHMEIDTDKCIGCRRCEAVCKASCIDAEGHAVDMSRCVLCFNCLDACKDDAITYTPFRKGAATPLMQRVKEWIASRVTAPAMNAVAAKEAERESRRRFIGTVGAVFAAGIAAEAENGVKRTAAVASGMVPEHRKRAVTPPGARSRESFLNRCTACQLCVSKCPQRVLRPSTAEYGIFHALQPCMDYGLSFCRHGCNLCTSLCPTGALEYLPVAEKKTAAVGKAKFILGNCVTQRDGVSCGACARKCPVQAIELVEYKGGRIPFVHEDLCTGCGKCEYVCPSAPYKAIYVEGIE